MGITATHPEQETDLMRKSIALAALTAAALFTAVGTANASTDEVVIHPEQVSAQCWFDLMDAGYTGHPDDSYEALYAPAAQLTALCGVAVLTAEDGSLVPATFYQH
jgi:hypothetical protein